MIEINLKIDYPTVDVALKRLDQVLNEYRKRGQLLKIVHGYGSTGKGGKIRNAIRKTLEEMKKKGKIKEYIKGENFSMFDSVTQSLLMTHYKEVVEDSDYSRNNMGITIIKIK